MWCRILWDLRATETFTLGKRVLPILHAISAASSFLVVILFMLGASMQVSYAFTNRRLYTIMLQTYNMGFIGDLKADLFFGTDAAESLDSLWLSGHLAYLVFGFILIVAMANIFIQVMGQAYDMELQEVEVSFTRARASRALQLMFRDMLLRGRKFNCSDSGSENYVWVCQRSTGG